VEGRLSIDQSTNAFFTFHGTQDCRRVFVSGVPEMKFDVVLRKCHSDDVCVKVAFVLSAPPATTLGKAGDARAPTDFVRDAQFVFDGQKIVHRELWSAEKIVGRVKGAQRS